MPWVRWVVVLLVVSFAVSWWRFSPSVALALLAVSSVVALLQWRFALVSRLADKVAAVASHVLAFVVQVVIVPGRRPQVPGAWLSPEGGWPEVSSSLWSPSPLPRRRSRLWPWVVMLVVVVGLDFAAGSVWAALSPPGKVAGLDRLESARSDAPELAQVQADGDAAALVVSGDGAARLWTLTPIAGEVFSFDPVRGRPVYTPAEPVATVAVVGGSSAFGLGQTDDGQLASALARELEARRWPATVVNAGMPGFTTYQSAVDLERRLASGQRFDVVVAVTGWNDAVAGALGVEVPGSLLDADVLRMGEVNPLLWWADKSAVARAVGYAPRVSRSPIRRYRELALNPSVSFDRAVASARVNVAEGVRLLRDLQERYGFELLLVWPPSSLEHPGSFPVADVAPQQVAAARELFARARDAVAVESGGVPPLDLGSAVDVRDCFVDLVHTIDACSQRQAAVVADRVLLEVLS